MIFEIIEGRIDQLKDEWCDLNTMNSIYGIDFRSNNTSNIRRNFCDWANSFRKKRDCFCENKVNRWMFELFLQQNNLMTTKQAAISLAMGRKDFEKIILKMNEKEMIVKNYKNMLLNCIIDKEIVDNLSKCLPSLEFKLFRDRFVYIKTLHDIVEKDLQIVIKPIRSHFADNDTDYATDYDILTDEPMASHNGVWLDFNKPIALKPDSCSIYTYCRNKDIIDHFLFTKVDEQDIIKAEQKLIKYEEQA